MVKANAKIKILKELEKTPIVHVACQRVGISRNTFYRWRENNPDFRKKVIKAIRSGIELVNDAAESNVLNGIKKGDTGYTKYWLSHRHDSYKKPFTHRESGISILEAERIREYYKIRKSLSNLEQNGTKQQIEEAKKESRKFFDAWGKVVKRREKKLRNQNDDKVKRN